MQGLIPVTGMFHIGVVVPDAEKSMKNFSEVFGIPKWDVRDLTDDQFGNPLVRGRKVKQHFISALGMGGPVSFELCQPLAGDRTLYAEFLDEHGPGLHHVMPTILNEEEFLRLLPKMEERGLKFSQSAQITDKIDYWYMDTEDLLGTMVEFLVLKDPDAVGNKPNYVVEFGADVIATEGKLPIDKLYHYAVTARRPSTDFKAGYEDVFGMSDWFDFESIPNDTVLKPHYENQPGDYRFKSWSGRKGALGVEAVEPLAGKSIFDEKLVRSGPGLHHVMTTITNAQKWETIKKWLEQRGMYVAQDAWTPDGATYIAFVDAREKLDGLYIEVLVRQDDSQPMQGAAADILIGA